MSHAGELGKGLVDVDRLGRFMDDQGLAVGAPIEVTRITTGHSNEVFRVERGELTLALRRPPRVGYGPGAHDMVREYRVLSALGADPARAVPVPRTYALCQDPEVLGAPFFLMELLDGVVARDDFPAVLVADGSPRQVSYALVDTLVALHAFDWEAAGLGDLGRPAGFLQRQTDRWLGMIERVKVREIVEIDDVAAWLRTHIPTVEQKPCLIHWDYRLDNVMFRPELPVRVPFGARLGGRDDRRPADRRGLAARDVEGAERYPRRLAREPSSPHDARGAMTSLLAISWPTDTPRRRNATSHTSPSTRCWDSSSWQRSWKRRMPATWRATVTTR